MELSAAGAETTKAFAADEAAAAVLDKAKEASSEAAGAKNQRAAKVAAKALEDAEAKKKATQAHLDAIVKHGEAKKAEVKQLFKAAKAAFAAKKEAEETLRSLKGKDGDGGTGSGSGSGSAASKGSRSSIKVRFPRFDSILCVRLTNPSPSYSSLSVRRPPS